MINVTKKYIEVCESNTRNSYVIAKYGLYDREAKNNIGVVVTSSIQPFSNTSQTYDEIKNAQINYISCEPNRVKLDGTFAFIQDKSKINVNQNIGYWSSVMSDKSGNFLTPVEITYNFNKEISYTDLTLHFQEIVKDIDIKYYLNDELLYTREIRNNKLLSFETKETIQPLSVNYFNKLVISILSTQEAYRYVKFNEIDFGVYDTFEKSEFEDLEIIQELNIDGTDLSSNSCNISIKDLKGEYDIVNPYNKLKNLQDRQQINIYHYLKVGASYKEIPLGTFLVKNFDYSDRELKLECYDDLYFMNKTYYGSKFYNNEPIYNVLKDLFDYFNYSESKYTIEDTSTLLTGYIPNVEFREALRLICESSCNMVMKTRLGVTRIFKNIGSAVKIFKNTEIRQPKPQKNLYNNVIDIKEYNYVQSEETQVLYRGVIETKGTHLIIFEKAPIYYDKYKENPNALKVSSIANYDIVNLYANCCEIETKGNNVLVELKGTIYNVNKVTKRIKKQENLNIDDYAIGQVDNPLINSLNSNDVAKWKLNRNDIKYSFSTKSHPYIEIGDVCKYQLPYKNLNGKNINKDFVVTKLTFNIGIQEDVEGE